MTEEIDTTAREPVAQPYDLVALVDAYCRSLTLALPRGKRGVGAAEVMLIAFAGACRLGWSDMVVSAPGLFELLTQAGLIARRPKASEMPAALRLIDSISPLVTRRSERRWVVHFGSAYDPEKPQGIEIHEAVTVAMAERPQGAGASVGSDQLSQEGARREEEIARLQAALDRAEIEATDSARQISAYQSRLRASEEREEQLRSTAEGLAAQVSAAEKKMKKRSSRVRQLESKVDLQLKENLRVEARSSKCESQLATSRGELRDLRKEFDEQEQKLKTVRSMHKADIEALNVTLKSAIEQGNLLCEVADFLDIERYNPDNEVELHAMIRAQMDVRDGEVAMLTKSFGEIIDEYALQAAEMAFRLTVYRDHLPDLITPRDFERHRERVVRDAKRRGQELRDRWSRRGVRL